MLIHSLDTHPLSDTYDKSFLLVCGLSFYCLNSIFARAYVLYFDYQGAFAFVFLLGIAFGFQYQILEAFQVTLVVKNLPANAGYVGLILS